MSQTNATQNKVGPAILYQTKCPYRGKALFETKSHYSKSKGISH